MIQIIKVLKSSEFLTFSIKALRFILRPSSKKLLTDSKSASSMDWPNNTSLINLN